MDLSTTVTIVSIIVTVLSVIVSIYSVWIAIWERHYTKSKEQDLKFFLLGLKAENLSQRTLTQINDMLEYLNKR
jgi:hypothetical protein